MILVNPDSGVNRDIPNIALALLATHYGAPVVDLNTRPDPPDRYLDRRDPALGISVQSRTQREAERIRKRYVEKYPDATVKSVSGFLDVQCCYPYLKFEDDLNPGIPFGDDMPVPDYGLFDSAPVFERNWRSGQWRYAIMTSLGCPFGCTYCMAAKRRIDLRSVESCIEELKIAKVRWGIKKFLILDDCFNANRKRVLDFCEQVAPLGLQWGCANGLRADRFDDEIARALKHANCDFISFGVESSAPDVLVNINKGETLGQIADAVRIASRHFDIVNGYFILGLPGSSYEKDLDSLRWALGAGLNAHFSYHVPVEHQRSGDAVFYGDGAVPLSDEYDKALQKRLFELTACMRGDFGGGRLWRFIKHFMLVLRYAPSQAPRLVIARARHFINEPRP